MSDVLLLTLSPCTNAVNNLVTTFSVNFYFLLYLETVYKPRRSNIHRLFMVSIIINIAVTLGEPSTCTLPLNLKRDSDTLNQNVSIKYIVLVISFDCLVKYNSKFYAPSW